MVDYLGDKRALPKTKSPTPEELQRAINEHQCRTCEHYTFYFCAKLNQPCGPNGSCVSPTQYRQKLAV